jgi:hypothetical protein
VHPSNEQDALFPDYCQLVGKTEREPHLLVLQERSRPVVSAALHSLDRSRLCKTALAEFRIYQTKSTSVEVA